MGDKNAGNEKACVGQLCHIQEQLQLYVEESIPRVSRKCRSCTASQQHMIDICILCNELKQYKRGLLHGDRVGTHLLIILVHWPWTWTWTHRRLDSKALCSSSLDMPFTKPSVDLLNTPVLILLRILVKVKVLHLWKLRLYVSDGDKAHRDKRGHLERRHRLARDSMSIPPKCHPCTLNPCLALDLTLEFFKILTHIYWQCIQLNGWWKLRRVHLFPLAKWQWPMLYLNI